MSRYSFILILFSVAVAFFVTDRYNAAAQADARATLEYAIATQSAELQSLTQLISQNRSDDVANTIVSDCDPIQRRQFEQGLNRLAILSRTDLQDLKISFAACAAHTAEQRTLMTIRLAQTFAHYQDVVTAYQQLTGTKTEQYQLDTWEELLNLEQERSQNLQTLVRIQADIIDELERGEDDAGAVAAYLEQAQAISARNITLNQQIADLRATLETL